MVNNIFTGIIGVLIVIGLIVLIVIESTTPKRVKTITKTSILPIPYPRRRTPYRPYVPGKIIGDRSNPFCAHTKHGCYPGTTTPIP